MTVDLDRGVIRQKADRPTLTEAFPALAPAGHRRTHRRCALADQRQGDWRLVPVLLAHPTAQEVIRRDVEQTQTGTQVGHFGANRAQTAAVLEPPG